MKMSWDEFERFVGIERNVKRAPTRVDVDRMRRKRLSRPWRGVKAKRKR